MNTAVCSILRSRLSPLFVALLFTITLLPSSANAQDAAMQASQQATDQAMQANQQAMQNAQTAAMDNTTAYSSSHPQSPMPSANMPVPAQIRSAHTIFLANDGASPNFPLDSNSTYAAFYEALQAWGHYQFATSAQQADLIFQLHGTSPITDISGYNGGVYSTTTPAFQLTIRDPKSNTRLWIVTSPIFIAPSKSQRVHWQQVDVTNLVSRVKVLAGQPLSPTETATLTTVPNYHRGRAVAIVVGGFVALSAGGFLLGHHLYENGLANQKASQDAFCKTNNIPLSECAGG